MKWNKKKRLRIIFLSCILLILLDVMVFMLIVLIKPSSNKSNKNEQNNSSIIESLLHENNKEAKICIAGDIMIHKPMLRSTYYNHDGTYDYSGMFKYIEPYYQKADYTVCTFEGALTDSNYTGYPTFTTPKNIMDSIQNSGVDLVLLGSNHAYDDLDRGIHATMDYLDSIGLDYIGMRKSEIIKPYKIVEINGIKIGMIDYVYEAGKEKTLNFNKISESSKPLINTFNYNYLSSFYGELKERYLNMKEAGCDVCIVFMHWGEEYHTEEVAYQREMAQNICNIGFNAIIGSHPHVIEPVDILTSKDGMYQTFVAYAIGNHVSNQRVELLQKECKTGHTEDGMMLYLTITKDQKGNISIKDIDYLYTWVYMLADGPNNEYFILPLDDQQSLEKKTGIQDLGTDPQDSINRTDKIVSEGKKKVQQSLPIQIPKL